MAELLLPNKPYNLSLLDSEIRTVLNEPAYSGLIGRKGKVWAQMADNPPAGAEATVLEKAAAHDGGLLTEAQELQIAESVARDQIVTYIRRQMTSASPDSTATIKATVQTFIDTNVRLQRALTNVAALYGYNTGTNAGYLQAALVLIGWMK